MSERVLGGPDALLRAATLSLQSRAVPRAEATRTPRIAAGTASFVAHTRWQHADTLLHLHYNTTPSGRGWRCRKQRSRVGIAARSLGARGTCYPAAGFNGTALQSSGGTRPAWCCPIGRRSAGDRRCARPGGAAAVTAQVGRPLAQVMVPCAAGVQCSPLGGRCSRPHPCPCSPRSAATSTGSSASRRRQEPARRQQEDGGEAAVPAARAEQHPGCLPGALQVSSAGRRQARAAGRSACS